MLRLFFKYIAGVTQCHARPPSPAGIEKESVRRFKTRYSAIVLIPNTGNIRNTSLEINRDRKTKVRFGGRPHRR